MAMALRNSVHRILYRGYEQLLTKEIREGPIPAHIAIIMDGNRRFANKLGIETFKGHYHGADTTENVIEWCWEFKVKQLTLYAFSTENFKRSESEKENLFKLIGVKLDEICKDERTHQRRMKVKAIGNIDLLPKKLQQTIAHAERTTRNYDGLYLNIALAYGGRRELVDATRLIAEKIQKGMIRARDLNEEIISNHMYTGNTIAPDVNLIIRTGGDERLSNFLPWQSCGNECAAYFCAPYWPEFRKIDFLRAIRTYQTREQEKQRNTILRIIHLLATCGQVEAEEVIQHSRKILQLPREEIQHLLKEIAQHNHTIAKTIKW
jgi:tritrans,polycis-undecaprenyl-diphosphate synthase [geranylgeranyl-diphosphate specific]